MPRKPQKSVHKKANEAWVIEMMLYGYCTLPSGKKGRRMGLTVWDPPLPTWSEVEAELLPGWIREYPCSRPWGWWQSAPEPRRRVGGTGRRERQTIFEFGIPYPNAWFRDADPDNPPLYESQGAYLLRLDLLSEAEKGHLAKNPGLLEPEAISYRLSTGPEIHYAGYSGPGYYEDHEDE